MREWIHLGVAVLLCYVATQVVGLAVAALGGQPFILAGAIITAIPTFGFSVVMAFLTRRAVRRKVHSCLPYVWSLGLTAVILLAVFPFMGFGPPRYHVPYTWEWICFGAAAVAGLAGTGALHVCLKMTGEAQHAGGTLRR